MNPIAWLAGPLLSTLAVGQGTVNLSNNFNPPGSPTRAFVLDENCQPMAKQVGRVEVLDLAGNVISRVQDGTGNPFGANGLFFLGVTAIPGTQPGGSGAIMIRVWDNTTGSTYDSARVKGAVFVTLAGLGGGAIPPPSLGTAGNFTGMYLCFPEPSTWALAVTGFLALGGVMHRQRQRSRG